MRHPCSRRVVWWLGCVLVGGTSIGRGLVCVCGEYDPAPWLWGGWGKPWVWVGLWRVARCWVSEGSAAPAPGCLAVLLCGGWLGGLGVVWWVALVCDPAGVLAHRVVGWGVGVGWCVENCIVDASIFVAKFLRAHGGCLGTRNR